MVAPVSVCKWRLGRKTAGLGYVAVKDKITRCSAVEALARLAQPFVEVAAVEAERSGGVEQDDIAFWGRAIRR